MLVMPPTFLSAPDFTALEVPRPSQDDLERRYERILALLDGDEQSCLAGVREWDEVRRSVDTWANWVELRFRQDTRDPERVADTDALNEMKPRLTGLDVAVKRKMLASPARSSLEREFGGYVFERWASDIAAFAPEVEDLARRESALENDYTSLLASISIEFRGRRYTSSGIDAFMQDQDRETRREALRARYAAFDAHASRLDEIFAELVAVRDETARRLGYANFVELGYYRMVRTDYTAKDVARYRDAIARELVPLASEIVREQAQRLGVDRVMAWDERFFNPAGAPKPPQNPDALLAASRDLFARTHPAIASFANEMIDGAYLDVENREGKAGGGFCTWFPTYGMPYIFANFNGTTHDANVLVHEMGHAFQGYSSRSKALVDTVWATYDASEIHSMAMEFFTAPAMEVLFGASAAQYRKEHLATSLLFMPYGAAVDDFQHFVYERPTATPAERHEYWRELERKYLPWRDHGDLPFASRGAYWQQQRHIYVFPFYYIDYTLAMLCALQFHFQSEEQYAETIERYVTLCARGGEAPFQNLVRSAGLRSPFDEGAVADVVQRARRSLQEANV